VVELVAGFYDAVHGGVPPGPPHRSDVAAVAQLLHDGWEPDAVRHLWRYAAARVAEGSPAVGRPAGAVSMYGPPAGAAWRARSSPAPSESGVNAAPVRQLELERWKREQERARDLELDARVREELHRHVRGGWAFDADVVVTGRAGDALEVLARDRAVVDVLSGGQYAEAWDATAAAVGARRVRFVVPAGAVA
jgi:hypothetical protein